MKLAPLDMEALRSAGAAIVACVGALYAYHRGRTDAVGIAEIVKQTSYARGRMAFAHEVFMLVCSKTGGELIRELVRVCCAELPKPKRDSAAKEPTP